jgi:hypothetical protein
MNRFYKQKPFGVSGTNPPQATSRCSVRQLDRNRHHYVRMCVRASVIDALSLKYGSIGSLLDRHICPVVNKYLFPVFGGIFVVNDQGGVAITDDAVG